MMNSFALLVYSNPIISWIVTILGIAILLGPAYIAKKVAERFSPRWKFAAMGVGFGIVSLPLSLWLYFQYYVDPVRALIFGFPGLFMMMFHMWPLEGISIPFLLEATDVTKGTWGKPMLDYLVFGGAFWGTVYGIIGLVIDTLKKKKVTSNESLKPTRIKPL